MLIIRLPLALLALCSIPSSTLAQLTFVQIGREHSGGLVWLDPDIFPAMSEDGTVAFVGSHDLGRLDGTRLFVGDGGPLTELDIEAASLSAVTALGINDQGQIMIEATRTGSAAHRGVYTTTANSGVFSTYYEALDVPHPPEDMAPVGHAAMSQNGTIAFTTIVDGRGVCAVDRSTVRPACYATEIIPSSTRNAST